MLYWDWLCGSCLAESFTGAALLSMLLMSAIATLLLPSLWLHPLGPLLKNIPLAAMFWILIQKEFS